MARTEYDGSSRALRTNEIGAPYMEYNAMYADNCAIIKNIVPTAPCILLGI